MKRLKALLELHEGNKRFPYVDTVGKVTIGIGFNLTDVGLFPEEIQFILDNRLRLVAEELVRQIPWVDNLDDVRGAVLIDMAFNLGIKGLLGFHTTLKHVRLGQYAQASVQMLNSKWARQVKGRANRLSTMMLTGEWPNGLAK